MQTLKDWLPIEFFREFMDTPAAKYLDVRVLVEHGVTLTTEDETIRGAARAWIGPHKNVYNWVILENGKAVGFNENPAKGWSFPVLGMPKPASTKIKVISETYCEGDAWGCSCEDTFCSCQTETYESTHISGIQTSTKYFDIVVPFKVKKNVDYYLVVGTYSSGDSFSTVSGKTEVVDMFQNHQDAEYMVEQLTKFSDINIVELRNDADEPYKFAPPWYGYFETLDSVDIQVVSIVK